MSAWISVNERLPEENLGVIVTDGDHRWSSAWMSLGDEIYWYCHGWGSYEHEPVFGPVTHWMPLPEPPESE